MIRFTSVPARYQGLRQTGEVLLGSVQVLGGKETGGQIDGYNAVVTPPQFTVLAGPNGAGKSTSAPAVLPPTVAFINADEIAKNLPPGVSPQPELRAGRLLLQQWTEREEGRADFAIETTLASRSLAGRITRLRASGYQVHLLFFWLQSVDLAIARVAERVRRGGHDIPETTIRRRYQAGLRNFFDLYRPLVHSWRVYDNSLLGQTRQVAAWQFHVPLRVYDAEVWQQLQEQATGNG